LQLDTQIDIINPSFAVYCIKQIHLDEDYRNFFLRLNQ